MKSRPSLLPRALAPLAALASTPAAWSHPGPHPPTKAPPPVVAPALSPGVARRGDPLLNGFQTDLGITTGGIRYEWTVSAVGTFSTTFPGIAGASSWSDPEQLSPDEGRTRAACWVAVDLRFPSRLTLRLRRADSVPDPLAPLPGGTGGPDLVPAYTLYSGWHQQGSEEATFPNRATPPWAPALVYRGHADADGGEVAEASYELPAGRYSLVLGGVGGPSPDPGRQGFLAEWDFLTRAAAATLVVASRARATRARHTLRGRFRFPESAAYLAVQFKGRTRFLPARGPAWSVVLAGLRPGPNEIYLTAISIDGRLSPRKKVVITRP